MKTAYIILAISIVVKAQIPNLGFCPDYLPMAEFDMERFMGKWYEAERYFQFSEVASRCVVTDYAKAPSGRIYVSNEVTNRLTGVKRVIGGNLEVVGKLGEARLNVKYSTTPIATETQLTVLDTDYDTFAVVWSCSGFGPIHAQSAWVMTRDRLPSGVVLQRAYGVLDKFKISRTFFVKTDQEGCAVAASDINAANGITPTSTVPEATGSDQKIQEKSALGAESAPAPVAVPAPAPAAALPAAPVPASDAKDEQKPVPLPELILNQSETLQPAPEQKQPELEKPKLETAKPADPAPTQAPATQNESQSSK